MTRPQLSRLLPAVSDGILNMQIVAWVVSIVLVVFFLLLGLSNLRTKSRAKMAAMGVVGVVLAAGYVWLHNTDAVGESWNQFVPAAVLVVAALVVAAAWVKRNRSRSL